jgi:hypothetical protein
MTIRFVATLSLLAATFLSTGCATNSWASPNQSLGSRSNDVGTNVNGANENGANAVGSPQPKRGILDRRINRNNFERATGVDPRARAIEKRLGME